MDNHHDKRVRKIKYRLQHQGMLELDVWMSPLVLAADSSTPEVLCAIEKLISYEAPVLLAMQAGVKTIPEELKPWLNT